MAPNGGHEMVTNVAVLDGTPRHVNRLVAAENRPQHGRGRTGRHWPIRAWFVSPLPHHFSFQRLSRTLDPDSMGASEGPSIRFVRVVCESCAADELVQRLWKVPPHLGSGARPPT